MTRTEKVLFFTLFGLGAVLYVTAIVAAHRREQSSGYGGVELDTIVPVAIVMRKAGPTRLLLENLANTDPSVDPDRLIGLVTTTFTLLQSCWQSRDYTPMQPLLMPDLYATHLAQLNAMIRQHEIDHINDLLVERVDLVHVRYTIALAQREFTALITARARDFYVDDRSGKFLRGDRTVSRFQEFWIFHHVDDRWLLREIEQSAESNALRMKNIVEGTDPDSTGPIPLDDEPQVADDPALRRSTRVHELIDRLASRDRAWQFETLTSLARAVMLAQESGTLSADTEQMLTPAGAAAVRRQIDSQRQAGETVDYRNLCVRVVDLVLARPAADVNQCEFMARVSLHAQTIVRRGDRVVRQDPYELPFVLYLDFARPGGQWKLNAILPPANAERAAASGDAMKR